MEIDVPISSTRWRIDAWLPADGIVFISQRAERDDVWEEPEGDGDSYGSAAFFMKAPDFRLEQVERGIAFGAVQRGAQEGFSLDGESEFGFDSIEQLSTFVRRVYAGSGPGSDGGGETGQPPRAPDQGPRDPWPRLVGDGANEPNKSRWSLPKERSVNRSEIEHRLRATDCDVAAADLLLASIEDAFEHWSGATVQEQVLPQVQAAMLLAPKMQQYWSQELRGAIEAERRRARTALLHHDLTAVRDVVDGRWHDWPWLWPASRPPIVAMAAWRLPFSSRERLGLPVHVRTWLDAICYLRADRNYFVERSVDEWAPLLLSLFAPICLGSRDGWHTWQGSAPTLIERSMRMAAEMIPAEAMAVELEANVASWSRRELPARPSAPQPARA